MCVGAQHTAERAGRELKDHPAFEGLARGGVVAYAAVYLVLAWLAMQLAFGDREGPVSRQGALHELAGGTMGMILLWAACVGFAALCLWEALNAWLDPRPHGNGSRALARAASAGRALLYAVFAASAGATAAGDHNQKHPDSYTSKLMATTAGPWLVGAVGVAVMAYAVGSIYIGVTDRYEEQLGVDGRAGWTGTASKVLGRTGYVSKGVAFGIVGSLFVWAAATHEPHQAGGLDAALSRLLDAPLGPALLAAVAVGFGCYGLFNLFRARYLGG